LGFKENKNTNPTFLLKDAREKVRHQVPNPGKSTNSQCKRNNVRFLANTLPWAMSVRRKEILKLNYGKIKFILP